MIELLRRFGGKFRRYMVIGPACKLIEVIFDLLTPLVIAQMIDKGIGSHDVNAVIHYGMVLGAMAVIGISFTLVCQKMAALTSQGMGTDIRGALYGHINKLSYAELDRFGTPSLITRITNDVNQVQLAVALGVRMLIRWPFLAVGSMVAALAIDLKLGIIFLICTPAIGLVFWFVMARCIPYYKQLQAKLDRIALDSDAEIEEKNGMSCAQLIEKHGEAEFRELESEAIAALGKRSGAVIATGGGCVTRKENYDLLHQNGIIFWLKRDIDQLPREGRPLSAGDLAAMYDRRKACYERFADHIVDNNGTVEDTVQAILDCLK